MAAESSSLKFVDFHNIAGYLLDPPAVHKEFNSMIAGLNSCRISHALRATPVIRKDFINDFWNNASFNGQGANGAGSIESVVKGTQIIISEQTIREVLKFGDANEFPTEFSADQVMGILEKMCYEGSYPPTVKKLLPPYWRFLAHTFVICISGRKGGSDVISQTATSAIIALIMDLDYNFSKFVFEGMRSNLSGKKKDLFLMYPRFLQMIFDEKYPEIERTSDTLDVKALGPNTFGLMKQSRKAAKVAYQGVKELVKFGKFAETEGIQEAPVFNAEVADEHVAPPAKFMFSFEDIPDDEEVFPVFEPMEEQELETIVPQNIPTTEQIEAVKEQLQQTALKPPQSVPVTINESAACDQEVSDSGLIQRKRKRKDPRPGVLITEPIQETSTPTESIPMAQDDQSPIVEEENVFAEMACVAESSSTPTELDISKGKSKCPESEPVDLDKLQRRVFELEQDSAEKDLMIGKLDVRVYEQEKDNSEKDLKISELQANLGGLTALYFDLKQCLIHKFGDEFKTSSDEGQGVSTSSPSSTVPVPKPTEERVSRPAPDENLDQYLSAGPNTADERRAKQRRIDQEKLKKAEKMLIIKNSDQNIASSDRPEMFIKEVGKRFSDKYGDRSGIRMWGYDADKEMWVVKRKSGNIEYYKKKIDFMSWTEIDFSELIQSPFHNPSNAFKRFLEDQAKKSFERMKTASSFTKKANGVIDPHTNKTLVNVMWPPTLKAKSVPISKRLPDGTLDTMQFWVYDEETATVVIRLASTQIRLVDPKDLLKFGERDICHLSTFQILTENSIFETAAKAFTGMIATIIENKLWDLLIDGGEEGGDGDPNMSMNLLTVAGTGNAAFLDELLKARLDPDISDSKGRTPLHIAASKGHEECVLVLLKHACNIHLRDMEGNTALWDAIASNHHSIFRILFHWASISDPCTAGELLCMAAKRNDLTVMKGLLKHGLLVDSKDHHGSTAIQIAVSENNIEMVKLLVMNGADVNDHNVKNKIPAENLKDFVAKREVGYRIMMPEQEPVVETTTGHGGRRGEEGILGRSQGQFVGRVSIYKGLPMERKKNCSTEAGKLITLPSSLMELKIIAGEKFGFDATNAVVTDEDGAEIDSIEVIRDNDKLFIGEMP